MSEKTVIIVREPNKDIPEQYIRSVVATFNSCGGYAIQAMKDAQPVLITDRSDTGASLDQVAELLKAYTDHRILLTFSKLDKVEEKFLQPFDLTMEGREADVLMSYGIEGEFPTLVEAGITPEANFAKKIMQPNLNKFVKYSGGNLAKFLDEIKDPTFVDQIMVRIGERGVYCFFPPVGDPIWLGKNTLGSVFPWGAVSNTLGYKEEAPKASGQSDVKSVKPDAGKGWFNYKDTKASGPALPVDPPPVETKPAAPPELPPATQPDTKIDAPPAPLNDPQRTDLSKVPPPAGHWEYIPTGLSYKDRKNLVKRMTQCGHSMPEGWDQPNFRYWVVDYPSKAQNLPELKERLEQQQKDKTPKDMRDSAPRPVVPVKSGGQIAAEANLMVLTKDEKDRSNATILRITDRQGKDIPSPIDIQKAESKYPQWSLQFGVDSKRPDAWLPEDLAQYMQENGKGGFHMLLEYRRRAINAELALAATTPKAVTTKTSDVEVTVIEQSKTGTGGWGNWK